MRSRSESGSPSPIPRSVSHNRIGDVLVGQGHLTEALRSFREGFAIAERLAKSDLGNARWQQDLWVSVDKSAK
jgi:hypothetical protein